MLIKDIQQNGIPGGKTGTGYQYLAQKEGLPPMAYVKRAGSDPTKPEIVYVGGYMTSLNHKMVKSVENFLCDEGGYPFIK